MSLLTELKFEQQVSATVERGVRDDEILGGDVEVRPYTFERALEFLDHLAKLDDGRQLLFELREGTRERRVSEFSVGMRAVEVGMDLRR